LAPPYSSPSGHKIKNFALDEKEKLENKWQGMDDKRLQVQGALEEDMAMQK